ncbi:hypothetical protein QBC45DRAFT_78274 [Copromyces sp. CBS 386.78]|nr:hypothetical protein QBC45DRAFT_78274 [Copromyces sp. CBS 386.78]
MMTWVRWARWVPELPSLSSPRYLSPSSEASQYAFLLVKSIRTWLSGTHPHVHLSAKVHTRTVHPGWCAGPWLSWGAVSTIPACPVSPVEAGSCPAPLHRLLPADLGGNLLILPGSPSPRFLFLLSRSAYLVLGRVVYLFLYLSVSALFLDLEILDNTPSFPSDIYITTWSQSTTFTIGTSSTTIQALDPVYVQRPINLDCQPVFFPEEISQHHH